MKKAAIISVSLLLVVAAGRAQDASVTKGTSLINLGVGVGGAFSGFSSSVPVSVSWEKGAADNLSFGGQVAYASSTFNDGYGYNVTETAIYIGARASYHFGTVLKLPSKVDVYGGVSLGYVIASVSDNAGDAYTASGGVGYGLYVGGKYYFASKLGIFAELGYQSLSTANAGLAFKF